MFSTARYGSYDQKRLSPRYDGCGQGGIRRFVGEVLLAGEEPYKGPALSGDVIAERAAECWIGGLERVEEGSLRGLPFDMKFNLSVHTRQYAQMSWECDADHHRSVWTSTESTAGRSRTMGDQLSPASAEA